MFSDLFRKKQQPSLPSQPASDDDRHAITRAIYDHELVRESDTQVRLGLLLEGNMLPDYLKSQEGFPTLCEAALEVLRSAAGNELEGNISRRGAIHADGTIEIDLTFPSRHQISLAQGINYISRENDKAYESFEKGMKEALTPCLDGLMPVIEEKLRVGEMKTAKNADNIEKQLDLVRSSAAVAFEARWHYEHKSPHFKEKDIQEAGKELERDIHDLEKITGHELPAGQKILLMQTIDTMLGKAISGHVAARSL